LQQPDDDDLERLDNNNSSIKDTEDPGGYVIVIVTVDTWTRTEPYAAFSECFPQLMLKYVVVHDGISDLRMPNQAICQ
jgi:hypothetical protein